MKPFLIRLEIQPQFDKYRLLIRMEKPTAKKKYRFIEETYEADSLEVITASASNIITLAEKWIND